MKVCDICKTRKATWDKRVTIDYVGNTEEAELCNACYKEFVIRKNMMAHKAYLDTIEAMTGKIPPKFHWWNPFTWYVYGL